MAKFLVEYTHNNSGGSQWISRKEVERLEAVGWKAFWFDSERFYRATKVFEASCSALARAEGEQELEFFAGLNLDARGCPCCGPPHYVSVEVYHEGDEDL